MTIYRFTVEGPLKGYRASIRRAFDPKYREFKDRVAWTAVRAGVPIGKLDPEATPVRLSVFVYWKNRPRIDWKNLYGAIEDSCFTQDRWVQPGALNGFNCGTRPEEQAEVVIEVGTEEGASSGDTISSVPVLPQ